MDRKNCLNCYHNRMEHCYLGSCDCATAVLNQEEDPPRWMSFAEGLRIDREMVELELRKFQKRRLLNV